MDGLPDPALTERLLEPDGPRADPRLPNLMTLYLREVRRFGRLPAEREFELLERMAQGHQGAREAFICHHLGLVIAMARHFGNRGLELLDLIEEGNLGMLVALGKFEAERGLRFSTYAAWWIRYYLQTAIATQVPIVRPPLRVQQRAGREAWQHWVDSHEGPDSAPPESAAPLVTPVPLDDAHADGHTTEAGLQQPDVFDEVSERHDGPRLAALLHELVEQLPPRQRDVIVARFGLDGQDECTLQQLSARGGVTRERIRQVQVAALDALRAALEDAGVTRDAALA